MYLQKHKRCEGMVVGKVPVFMGFEDVEVLIYASAVDEPDYGL
jgi:hypothetical protein